MKSIYYLAYKVLGLINKITFTIAHKSYTLSYQMLDKAGGRHKKRRKPLTAIYKAFRARAGY